MATQIRGDVDIMPLSITTDRLTPTADHPMGGFSVTDVADPVDPQDAATKAYVDAAVAGAGGGTPAVSGEVPTGAIDGVNTVFTTAADYDGLRVFQNGQRLTLGDDYTETGADEFTLAAAPVAPDVLLVDYGDTAGGGGGTTFTTGDGLVLATGVLDLVLDGASLTKSPTGLKVTAGASAGVVVQIVRVQTGAVATGTTGVPLDDTIPQNTEGDQYMTLAITPTAATNRLRIDVVAQFSVNAVVWVIAALFQDSAANALAASMDLAAISGGNAAIAFSHDMVAGTTSPTTFKLRAGRGSYAGTVTTFNGAGAVRYLGGVMASSLTITEYTP